MDRFGPKRCKVCRGKECLGGGNLRCKQRDPKESIIAGILDSYGGFRCVVTHEDRLVHHVRQGEFAFIALAMVHEPIAWGDIPGLIGHLEFCFEEWLAKRPNLSEEHHEAVKMYRLRRLEQDPGSLDITAITYT